MHDVITHYIPIYSSGHRVISVYGLDCHRFNELVCQFHYLEQEHVQWGSCVVRYLWVLPLYLIYDLVLMGDVVVASRIIIAVSVALPAASLCINRQLCQIVKPHLSNSSDVEVSIPRWL